MCEHFSELPSLVRKEDLLRQHLRVYPTARQVRVFRERINQRSGNAKRPQCIYRRRSGHAKLPKCIHRRRTGNVKLQKCIHRRRSGNVTKRSRQSKATRSKEGAKAKSLHCPRGPQDSSSIVHRSLHCYICLDNTFVSHRSPCPKVFLNTFARPTVRPSLRVSWSVRPSACPSVRASPCFPSFVHPSCCDPISSLIDTLHRLCLDMIDY